LQSQNEAKDFADDKKLFFGKILQYNPKPYVLHHMVGVSELPKTINDRPLFLKNMVDEFPLKIPNTSITIYIIKKSIYGYPRSLSPSYACPLQKWHGCITFLGHFQKDNQSHPKQH